MPSGRKLYCTRLIEIVNVGLGIKSGQVRNPCYGPRNPCSSSVSALALQDDFGRGAGEIGPEGIQLSLRVPLHRVELTTPWKLATQLAAELKAAVDSSHPIEVWSLLAIGEHHSDRRLASNVSAYPAHGKIGVSSEQRVVRSDLSPGEASSATSMPTAHGPSFPVSRTPHLGSTIRRVKSSGIGVWK